MTEFNLKPSNYNNLDIIKFSVDNILSKRIQPPFANTSFFMIINGKPKSGKTSLLVNMLTHKNIYKQVFNKIILACPGGSRKSLKDDIFEDLEYQYNELSSDLFNKIKDIGDEFQNEKSKRKKNQLLIIDDLTSSLKDWEQELKELAFNRRHIHLSIIILSQNLRQIPRTLRFATSHIIFFKSSNNLELALINEEYIALPKNQFLRLIRFVFDAEHTFIFIDKEKELYYKNLRQIIM